ncbi:MAG: sorbosone dehydrogenase family protein [Acaryochloris sp. RU_4_1]|nr:sorbosone dehydrogenase family protein [Acaryochloris sp. RU_4_1]NJR55346.1 sorbosone dehydrogenase family protein [Acaryochloris sp. CRU_2_0]
MKNAISSIPRLSLGFIVFLVACHQSQASLESGSVKTQTTQQPHRTWIKAAELPKPYASLSASQPPQVIPRPQNARLVVPTGFQVSIFAKGLSRPRWLAVAPNGDVLVAESYDHRIRVLRDLDKDGQAEGNTVLLSNLNQPLGMTFAPDQRFLYVANTDAVVRFPYTVGQTQINSTPQVVTTLPGQGYRQHWTRNLRFSPDGKRLFISVGSRSNAEEEELPRASIQVITLQQGSAQPSFGSLQTYAAGLRNPVGLDFHPQTQQLYTTVNERDGLGDDLVPDYLTSVKTNGFYGWPYTYLGKNRDPRLPERPQLTARTLVPEVLFQAHSAALGLVFYTGKQFPSTYHHDAFVAFRGSWNRSQGTGYKVVRVPFDKQGKPKGYYEDFVTGWLADPKVPTAWGRPVGLAVAVDGALLIADEPGGVIWRVSYAGSPASPPQQ